jgi:hypothetical protein
LSTAESRQRFFDDVFWDTYTDDTHGNADFFARLYYNRLKGFAGRE